MKRHLYLLLLPGLFYACHKYTVPSETAEKGVLNLKTVLEQWESENFATFRARCAIDFTSNSFDQKGQLILQMKNSEYIHMTISKLGFKVAECLIDKDSIHFVNTFLSEYDTAPLTILADYTDLPLSIEVLQDLILANAPYTEMENREFGRDADGIFLKGNPTGSQSQFEYRIMEPSLALSHILVNSSSNGSASAVYKEFQALDENIEIPYIRNFDIRTVRGGDISLDLELKAVKHNEQIKLQFDIPKSCKKVDLF